MNTEIFSGFNPIEKTTVPDTTSKIQFRLNTSPEGLNAETLPGINPVAKITVPDAIGKFQFTLNTLTPQQSVQSSTAAGVRALQNYEGIKGIYQDVSSLRARNDQQVRGLENVRTQLVKETGAKQTAISRTNRMQKKIHEQAEYPPRSRRRESRASNK